MDLDDGPDPRTTSPAPPPPAAFFENPRSSSAAVNITTPSLLVRRQATPDSRKSRTCHLTGFCLGMR